MNRVLRMLAMLARENLMTGGLDRRPEECLVMDGEGNVEAWHTLGADDGPITPVYHLNALACSRLTPEGGTVVDLACGSGRFAAYLARLRPDLRIVGFDLSGPMIETGNASLREAGLSGRVQLRQGDMTAFSDAVPPETAVINCLFAMHHLPGLGEVEQCLGEIGRARDLTACGFLIFDLVRPRHLATALDYPEVFTPEAAEAFKLDSTNSLIAAYSHDELGEAIKAAFGVGHHAIRSRLLPLYQAFWQPRKGEAGERGFAKFETRVQLPPAVWRQYRALRRILPGFPG